MSDGACLHVSTAGKRASHGTFLLTSRLSQFTGLLSLVAHGNVQAGREGWTMHIS